MGKEHILRGSTNIFWFLSRNHSSFFFIMLAFLLAACANYLHGQLSIPTHIIVMIINFVALKQIFYFVSSVLYKAVGFLYLSLTVTTRKANACSPRTPCYSCFNMSKYLLVFGCYIINFLIKKFKFHDQHAYSKLLNVMLPL